MDTNLSPRVEHLVVTDPVRGRRVEIGAGFAALSIDHKQFDGLMDPLVMVGRGTGPRRRDRHARQRPGRIAGATQ